MGEITWYKRNPHDALEGMRMLNLEERGAYNTVLDLIYVRDGNLPDDDRFIAGYLGVDIRVWRRIKSRLIALEKLYVKDGTIRNVRADAEVLTALAKLVSNRYAGRVSAKSRTAKSNTKSNKNNDEGSTHVASDASTGVSTIIEIENTLSSIEDKGIPANFDFADFIFKAGHAILAEAGHADQRKRGSIIGRWRKGSPDEVVFAAVRRCLTLRPADPVSWVTAAITQEKSRHAPASRRTADDEPANAFVRAAAERKAERLAAGE